MEGKSKIIIGVLLIVIAVLVALIAMTLISPATIQTDILETKGCTLNASHFANPINENGGFEVTDIASTTDIMFSDVSEDAMDTIVDNWKNGVTEGTSYQIVGLDGLLIQDSSGNGLTFYFEKNGKYYMLDSMAQSGTENGNIQIASFRGLSILAEFNEILTAWQNGMPNESNRDITETAAEQAQYADSSSQSVETSTDSASDSSSQSQRQEDQITSDGWNPKEHEVSREDLGDGNERVTYDDGYSRVVDKDGNILSYGY